MTSPALKVHRFGPMQGIWSRETEMKVHESGKSQNLNRVFCLQAISVRDRKRPRFVYEGKRGQIQNWKLVSESQKLKRISLFQELRRAVSAGTPCNGGGSLRCKMQHVLESALAEGLQTDELGQRDPNVFKYPLIICLCSTRSPCPLHRPASF